MTEINYNTELRHFAYPSISQFRNVIRNIEHTARYVGQDQDDQPIYDRLKPLPTLTAQGTTKLHGTNASIVFDFSDKIVYFQSRENVIVPTKDNAGFAGYMASIQKDLIESQTKFTAWFEMEITHFIIYGEWCGGSIQKGMAISGLDKMFVIFDIKVYNSKTDEHRWLPKDAVKEFKLPSKRIYNIYDYQTWELDINFDRPELSVSKLQDITLEIEEKCPVGEAFDKEGIGEGAVWKIVGDDEYNNSGFWFKVKGEKHSSSKVKVLADVDVERINSIREFCEYSVTDSRCEQSIQKLKESGVTDITRKVLGEFIRWIYTDIVKEELDTIQENGFEVKELGSSIANQARKWFFEHENEL